MRKKTHYAVLTTDQFLDEALAAEAAGRQCEASAFIERARCQERASVLARQPAHYWVEADHLLVESQDGTGPCPVLYLEAGTYDMLMLAQLLNQGPANSMSPHPSLTTKTMFVTDGEYITREDPLTVFCGDVPGLDLAAMLNTVPNL